MDVHGNHTFISYKLYKSSVLHLPVICCEVCVGSKVGFFNVSETFLLALQMQ